MKKFAAELTENKCVVERHLSDIDGLGDSLWQPYDDLVLLASPMVQGGNNLTNVLFNQLDLPVQLGSQIINAASQLCYDAVIEFLRICAMFDI